MSLSDNEIVTQQTDISANRILVVMPNWLGDGVMATPMLRALAGLYPHAHIATLSKPLIAPVVSGLPYVHACKLYPIKKNGKKSAIDHVATSLWVRQEEFDLAILLPNSFRSAWMIWRAGVTHRLGYAREMRGMLLTHRLAPVYRSAEQKKRDQQKSAAIRQFGGGRQNVGSAYQPLPAIDYYMALLRLLGERGAVAEQNASRQMALHILAEERLAGQGALYSCGILPGEKYVVLVPGANFGSSKCWPAEQFAQVARALADPQGSFAAKVIIASSPAEKQIVDEILRLANMPQRVSALASLHDGKGVPLSSLKEIVRGASLMICNDTGPRHFAAAFNVPVVTLFGPTDPRWAETFSANEKQVAINVPCGPCQFKKCPIDHRCMTGISAQMVLDAAASLLTAK